MNHEEMLMADCSVCHECKSHEHAAAGGSNPGKSGGRQSFIKSMVSSGAIRFAGWWSVFAGLLAVNSTCPVCGSQACPVGIGTTGIIAGLFAAMKQWGGPLLNRFNFFSGLFSGGKNKNQHNSREMIMTESFYASEIRKGFHPDGYRIDKTASPMDYYTKWDITPEGKWINPKATCFDSMPQEGWHKTDSFNGEKSQR